MNEVRYNFESFLDKIKDEDDKTIKQLAVLELRSTEGEIERVRPLAERKYHVGNMYVKKLREFLFYMNSGTKPATVDEEDFELYKKVVINLVAKRIYNQSALEIFDAVDV